MKSSVPKVLHQVCGRPLLYYPVRAALDCGASPVVVVVGPETRSEIETTLRAHLPGADLAFAVQTDQPGTAGAAQAGLSALAPGGQGPVFVLSGDTPLLRAADLQPLGAALREDVHLSFLTFRPENPIGYGRVLRDQAGDPLEIREQRDLRGKEEEAIPEVNAGVYLARKESLVRALERIVPENAQGEYYLTDVVRTIAQESRVVACETSSESAKGVNDRTQLSRVEEILFRRIRRRHEAEGVTFLGEVYVDEAVQLGQDVLLENGVRLRGNTQVGARTRIDVGSVVDDGVIGCDVNVKPYCVIRDSVVENRAVLGPFAHLRPESHIESEAHVGNFVETKKSRVRRGAKANHLAYLGDTDVGERANLGAGVIVCNYDGYMKRRTVIGRDAFVGSDCQLVAPVMVGEGAYVATATTVTSDVPAGALSVGRVRQINKEGYASGLRQRLAQKAEEEKDG